MLAVMDTQPDRAPTPRRTAIADAAIDLLATVGMHGLTHRNVDRELGLSPGSTSYYFRTREALVQATVARLVELDDADFTEIAGSIDAGALPEGLAARLFARWTAPDRRRRTTARFELLLAGRRGDAANPLVDSRRHFRQRTRETIARLGVPDPDRLAVIMMALFDGLLLDQIVSDGVRAEPYGELLGELERLLRSGRS